MGKVIELGAGRARHEHKRKDQRAAGLKADLRSAREAATAQAASADDKQQEATRKLLDLFKRKPAPASRPGPRR